MEYEQALQQLAAFSGRTEGLQRVYRFINDPKNPQYPVFFYRNHIEEHNKSVRFLVDDVADVVKSVYPDYNSRIAGLIADVHDDPEMLELQNGVNDISLGSSANLSDDQKQQKEQLEMERLKKMEELYPFEFGGFKYSWLLERALKKDILEARVVSWMDKDVGYCETRKEIEAGNPIVLYPPKNDPSVEPPASLYPKIIKALPEKLNLPGLRETGHPLFAEVPSQDYEEIARRGRPVTRESILIPTGDPIYNRFNRVHVARLTPEELTRFVTQREFFPAGSRLLSAIA